MNDNLPVALKLTAAETNVLKLLCYAETLADPLDQTKPKRLGGSLAMPDEAVFALRVHRIAVPHRVAPADVPGMNQVYFTVDQLFRYVEFACMRTGITINLDGSVTTRSGQTLTLNEIVL